MKKHTDTNHTLRFSSEKLLQQAVAGLLTRMPGHSEVQILQGPQELGKDIIFKIQGGFDQPVLCACVVKNTRVTGQAGRSEGARTVLLQAEQAFDTPHVDGTGRDAYVGKVFIVTPFELPPATIESVKGKLRERSGLVTFIGGPQLLDLFKKYWPDYLATEADAISRYLQSAGAELDADRGMVNLAQQYQLDAPDAGLQKVYVKQCFARNFHTVDLAYDPLEGISDKANSRWTHRDIAAAQDYIRTILSTGRHLQVWGYTDQSFEAVQTAGHRVIETLTTSWAGGVRQLAGRSPNKALSVSTEGEFRLASPEQVVEAVHRFHETLDETLLPLERELAASTQFLKETVVGTAALLGDARFRAACRLDDCLGSAPSSIIQREPGRKLRLPKDLIDLCDESLLIVGAPGMGKTSFCRWSAMCDLEKLNGGSSRWLPVYVPLARLRQGPLGSFEAAFLEGLGRSALLAVGDGNSHVRLYLDGLDEIADNERRAEVIQLVRSGVEGNPRFQLIVTSRDYVAGEWLSWLPRISLNGFDAAGIKQFVGRWLEKDLAREFYAQLARTPSLAVLMRVPLLAWLIVMVFRQTGQLPESKSKLYEIFVDLLSGGWDLVKGVLRKSEYGQRIKVMVLRSLAASAHTQRQREFDAGLLDTAIGSVSEALLPSREGICEELIQDGLLVRSGSMLQFPHLSFQEFLTAKEFLGDPQAVRASSALERVFAGDDWWREVISFYISLSSAKDACLWVQSVHQKARRREQEISDEALERSGVWKMITAAFPEYFESAKTQDNVVRILPRKP